MKEGERSKCHTRIHQNGKLYTLAYGKTAVSKFSPIEKVPFYHFLPSTRTLEVATPGCNLSCNFCNTFMVSQSAPELVPQQIAFPKEIIEKAINSSCQSISYTYTDPIASYELTLETMKLAKKKKIKNILVTNGFINPEPLALLLKYTDGILIGLKSFSSEFYSNTTTASLGPILENIKSLKKKKVWVEISYLVIPNITDDEKMITELATWIKKNLNNKVPLHLIRFTPFYKFNSMEQPTTESLINLKKVAFKYLKYIYVTDVEDKSLTTCSKCKKPIIERDIVSTSCKLKAGKCPNCGTKIPGKWK
jgi:pyruvate formate lyase activating enzyme